MILYIVSVVQDKGATSFALRVHVRVILAAVVSAMLIMRFNGRESNGK
jgi:hypothetical protein